DDSFAEFLLVADGTRVSTLNSGGQSLWPAPYTAPSRIVQLQAVDANGPDDRGRGVALATTSHIILLNENGTEQWNRLMPSTPSNLAVFDYNRDGVDELLVVMSSGQMRLYSSTGQIVWRY